MELHDAWLALCKYFGPQRKARALATFKQLDTDQSGTLDKTEFKMFIAMVSQSDSHFLHPSITHSLARSLDRVSLPVIHLKPSLWASIYFVVSILYMFH